MKLARMNGALVLLLLAGACSRSDSHPAETGKTPRQAAPVAARTATSTPASSAHDSATEPTQRTACELVTAAEMSEILGNKVVAIPNNSSVGTFACEYNPVVGVSPSVELKVEPGAGEAGMMGIGIIANQEQEPGLFEPLEGLGDYAVAVGPVVTIQRDEDLITIQLSGVEDAVGHARRIYKTVDARM